MKDATDFIGRGWAFPPRIGPRGGLALVSGSEEIEGSIRMILSTAPGERVMRPDFGCAIWDLLFAPGDPNTLGLMSQAVRDAVSRWEPRVELEAVQTKPDPDDSSRVFIAVTYVIKSTNDRRNLIYPFYVIPKEEG
ncbi:MAG: GPW/gp25 family protein [Actinomycetota bacterium]|nr:GPW/gp25 family protein [Actinomycetota bacterium]